MVIEKYKSMIKNLLPTGLAWPRNEDTNLSSFIEALAVEVSRVDMRVDDMLRESYPLTSSELLTDWERIVGIPDECVGLSETLQERREAVDRKLSSIGGQSKAYYIDVAARLGFDITIDEYTPFRAGFSRAGDPVTSEEWAHVWEVNTAETDTIRYFRAGQSTAGEALAKWGNEILECIINQLKPAHTYVIFTYGS